MAKYKVIEGFRDRYTGRWNKEGCEVELEEERAVEILGVGALIELIEEQVKLLPPDPKLDSDDELTTTLNLKKCTLEELHLYALENEIVLGEAKTKKEILTLILGKEGE